MRWVGLIMFAILAVGPLWAIGGHHHPKLNPSMKGRHSTEKFGPETISLEDNAPPGSAVWVLDGVPTRWRHRGILPSVITDPADPHRIWWFWPQVRQSRVWFAVSQDQHVRWQASTVKALAQSSTAPVPLRGTAQWVMTLETGHGVMPTMDTEPTGAFLTDMGVTTGVTGWMASVGSRPHSLVLTWGLRGPANTGLRLVTLWRWRPQSGWQSTLGVLQSEPITALAVPSIPWDSPRSLGWSGSTKTRIQGGCHDGKSAESGRGFTLRGSLGATTQLRGDATGTS